MKSRAQKGKGVAGPSKISKKRVRPIVRVLRYLVVPRDQAHRYGSRWVEEVGKKGIANILSTCIPQTTSLTMRVCIESSQAWFDELKSCI